MIGERIKMARKRIGLSQRDLAKQVGVSAMAISKYERGEDIPSSGVLIRLAKALGVTTEYFVRPTTVTLSVPSYRCRATLSTKYEGVILAEAQDWLERYIEIESLLSSEAPRFELPQDFNPSVAILEDVERVAVELRQAWQLGLGPIENLTEVLEEHGIKVVLVEGHEKFDACTFWANKSIPVIAIKRNIWGDRQRLTLAHELGHLILRPDSVDPEKAAYRFAGAFLVPKSAVFAELGPNRHTLSVWELHLLKHKYGLSMQGWIYRAKDLKIISESVAQRLFARFRRNGWHQQEPGDQVPPEEPQRMERLVMRAVAEDLISEPRASELLGKPLSEFLKEQTKRHAGLPVEICS